LPEIPNHSSIPPLLLILQKSGQLQQSFVRCCRIEIERLYCRDCDQREIFSIERHGFNPLILIGYSAARRTGWTRRPTPTSRPQASANISTDSERHAMSEGRQNVSILITTWRWRRLPKALRSLTISSAGIPASRHISVKPTRPTVRRALKRASD